MEKTEILEKEIESLEEQIAALEKKLIRKQKSLHTLNTDEHEFVKLEIRFSLNGILHRKHVSFARGFYAHHYKDGNKLQNFKWFLKYCALVEKQAQVSGTAIADTIREYAKYFEVSPEVEEELMQKYWHKSKLTLTEIFETQELDEIEYDVLYKNIESFMRGIGYMDSEDGFALAWYCNFNKEALQQRIDKMPKNIDKAMKQLFKIKP